MSSTKSNHHEARRRPPLHRLYAGLLVASAAVATIDLAHAQQGNLAPEPQNYSIAAGSLGDALNQLATQSKLQIVYSPEIMRGKAAPAISGRQTWRDALKKLLAGSGLEWELINDTTVAIRIKKVGAAWTPKTPSAQQPAPVAESDEPTTLEPLNVVGTRLKNIPPGSPVIFISSEDIARRGHSSIEDVLRDLPQNMSSQTSAAVDLLQPEYGDTTLQTRLGASGVNLRGLGTRATLILINGRRRAGSARTQGGFTDISSIPVAQIDYIEVLTDGASAIYGADAVAGVVNIVLKKDYAGTTVQLRREVSSTQADAGRFNVGRSFGWKTGLLTATVSYEKTRPADISSHLHVGPTGLLDFTDQGGANVRKIHVGQPGAVFESIEDSEFHFAGDLIGYVPGGQNGTALDPADLIDPSEVPVRSIAELPRVGPDVERYALRLDGEQTLSPNLTFDFGLGYTRQKDEETRRPRLLDFARLGGDGQNTWVPAENPYNHFGRDVLVGYSYKKEFAGMDLVEPRRQANLDANLGLRGKLPWLHNWDFELAYSFGRERSQQVLFDNDAERLRDATLNLNPFGDGNDMAVVEANRALLNAIRDRQPSDFLSRSHALEALTRGDLFSMPAGKAELAAGAQFRKEAYRSHDLIGTDSEFSDKSKRKVSAVFAELGLPLLQDLPGAKQVTLSLAARHERFNQAGSGQLYHDAFVFPGDPDLSPIDLVRSGGFDLTALTGAVPPDGFEEFGPRTDFTREYSNTSPLARLSWQVIDDLQLRATWGKSFLTPQASDQFGATFVTDFTSFIRSEGVELPPGVTHVIDLNGPNPNLKPQVAVTKTFGFDYTPGYVTGLTISATYNDTNFDNFIGLPTLDISIPEVFSNYEALLGEIFTVGQNGVLLWDVRQVNFLGRRSRTVDINVGYDLETGLGYWHLGLNAVRTLELSAKTLASLPALSLSDSEYGPSKWAADLALSWERSNWLASVGTHYSAAHRVIDPLSARPTSYDNYEPNLNPRRHSGSYTTVDMQVGYRPQATSGIRQGLTVMLGAQNVFDNDFPFVDNYIGFLSSRVSERGRVIYLDIGKEF